jgi:hypothetical protein
MLLIDKWYKLKTHRVKTHYAITENAGIKS